MKFPIQIPKLIIIFLIPLSVLLFLENFHYGAYFEVTSLAYIFFASYFIDLLQPFVLYFGLCLFEPWIKWMRSWWVKAFIVIVIPSAMELLQGLGLNVFGRNFDPFDFLAYVVGVMFAALLERQVLGRLEIWAVR